MKSNIFHLLILILLGGTTLGSPQVLSFEDEPYVDDIPFSTNAVAGTTWDHDLFVKIWNLEGENNVNDNTFNAAVLIPVEALLGANGGFEDEAYVDDIPFDTESLAIRYETSRVMKEAADEAYAADIPFDTEAIASEVLVESLLAGFNDEAYVDDIPFSTGVVFAEHRIMELFSSYRSEKASSDIPFNTGKIASDSRVAGVLKTSGNEKPVNDIPFNTEHIALIAFVESNFASYFNEDPADDIPFDTQEIFCEYSSCNGNEKDGVKDNFSYFNDQTKSVKMAIRGNNGDIRRYGIMEKNELFPDVPGFVSVKKDLKFKYSPLTTDL